LFEDQAGNLADTPLQPRDNADSFVLQMENFIDAIEGKAKPMNDAQQALYLMEMLDAIYLSSSSGREVLIAQA
jgi:predicted dehydrogenase